MKSYSFNTLCLLPVIVLAMYCCATPEQIARRNHYHTDDDRSGMFTVRKMILVDSMYIIYAQMGDSIYKIYSRLEMNQIRGGKKLCVDSTYRLYLSPLYSPNFLYKEDFDMDFNGRWIAFKKKTRRYCVDNIFESRNIRNDRAYRRCFKWGYWKDRHIKFLEEPDSELPAEWDSIPEIRARQSE